MSIRIARFGVRALCSANRAQRTDSANIITIEPSVTVGPESTTVRVTRCVPGNVAEIRGHFRNLKVSLSLTRLCNATNIELLDVGPAKRDVGSVHRASSWH